MAPGPEYIYVRFKVGILNLDDVEQTVRADVNCFFYFTPAEPIKFDGDQHVRFENISRPAWVPHFDFANEFEEVLCTDESYWLDTRTGLVFGRVNWIPSIQERFDHHSFPLDRQIIDVQTLMNNCQVKKWEITSSKEFPPEVSMDEPNWIAQAELNAVADAWDLKDLITHAINDAEAKSSIVHFQIFLEREAEYYFWNIFMVYFIIIFLKVVLIAFPYTEARFDFAMTLALTTVAFMFVTTTMVPKTSYLTFLDKYMLLGLGLLALRFLSDLIIQLVMEDVLPFGDEGIRASCGPENEINGVSPCLLDQILTGVLSGVWAAASLYVFIVTFLFQSWVRPDWKKLNMKEGTSKSQEREVSGKSEWHMQEKRIEVGDLSDAVDYQKSKEMMEQSNEKASRLMV